MTRVKELLRENPIKSQLCNVTSDALTNIALFALIGKIFHHPIK